MTEPVCDACGRSMTDPETDSTYVGMMIQIPDDDREAFHRIYPELTLPLKVQICYVCWLKSLGAILTLTI